MSEEKPTGQVAVISNDKALHHQCDRDLEGIAKKFVHIYSDHPDKVVNQAKAADVAIIEFEAGARDQFAICQQLRGVDQSSPIPIIGVLRSSSPHLAAKGIDAGAFYVLEPKPSASMLQAVVRAALHRRAMDTQLRHTSTTSMMPRTNFGREVASAASSCDQHHIPFGLMLCEISNYAEILEALGDAHIDELYEYCLLSRICG